MLTRVFEGEENLHQVYLDSIRYGAGGAPWACFHFVKFVYEDRPDWNEDCRGGFAVRTGKRIAAIIVATQGVELADHASGDWNGDGVADYLNRRYTLDYSASPFWSELHSVTLTGCREESDSRVTTFSYTSAAPEGTQAIEVIGASGFPGHLMDKDWVDFIDFNADGAPDILRTDPNGAGPHTVFLNAGESVGEAGAGGCLWGRDRSRRGPPGLESEPFSDEEFGGASCGYGWGWAL